MAKFGSCFVMLAILLVPTLSHLVMGAPHASHKKISTRKSTKSHDEMEEYRESAMRLVDYPPHPPLGKGMQHGWVFTRQDVIIGLKAILHIPMPHHQSFPKSIPPIIARLKDSTSLWVNDALACPPTMVVDKANELLLLLEQYMLPQCVHHGWEANVDAKPPPINGAHYYALKTVFGQQAMEKSKGYPWVPKLDGFKSLCMPLIPSLVARAMYISLHKQGYFLLDFGRGMVMRSKKKGFRLQRVVMGVHVFLCWMVHGPPSCKGLEVGHLCGHPNCINPSHLHWCSRSKNMEVARWHKEHGRGSLYVAPPSPLLHHIHVGLA
jgi:hypothetical protein